MNPQQLGQYKAFNNQVFTLTPQPKIKEEYGIPGVKQEPGEEKLQNFFQILEEREEIVRNIWNQIHIDISKRRSGKIRTYFPVMRIKTIMKLDPNVGPVSGDAAAAISFIAELFIHELSSLAWVETGKRSTTVMSRLDIYKAVKSFDHFDFLADVVPFWENLNCNGEEIKMDSKKRRKMKGPPTLVMESQNPPISISCTHSKLSLSEDHVACFDCGAIIRRF
ncbi:unnamed protein product [Allacma fusca]|uniref:Transcription factor CBF/NF-Y/archaeal histone domain-containing protein n=1 Tax=Allacma fusca TaxID=39272 RepID=A0A8J2KJN5_9HEXA|nr:unnamed protein product [Allacma fusca]